jgi:esterase/lipase superfamily enzyme
MLVAAEDTYPNEAVFIGQIQRAMARSADKDVLLYIHGYNNTFADGVLRTAQMAEDFGFKGVPVHYSWPSAGNALAYAFDRESIMASRAGLQSLIEALARLPAGDFSIVAHSVGSDLLMEVLRDLAIAGRQDVLRALDGVILVSPDIDLDVFRAQATRIGELPAPFLIISSENDRALNVSARLTGQVSRVGSLPDASALSEFEIIVLHVSAVSSGGDFLGHFTAATSPEAIQRIREIAEATRTLGTDDALRPGLIPGTVIRARQATRIILGQP